jgi:hypothetical protein
VTDFSCIEAVLLVDPPITKRVMVLPTRELQELNLLPDKEWYPEKQPPYPTFTSPVILPEDYRKWTIPDSQPAMMSMFDDLKFLQDGQRHAVTEDPRSCTSISRKIVISMWIAFIRRRFLNLLNVSTLVSVNHSGTDFLNRASWAKREWDSTWHRGIFSNLVNARFKLDIVRGEVTGNLAALGLTQHTLNVDQNVDAEEWEKAGWESVIRLTLTVQQMVEIFMQSYSQAASIQETKTSNDLTRSVNRITTLATVLLPISVISGVFSINGDFALGAAKDWVFWAVTGPVLALTAFLLFTNAIEVIKSLARRIFSRRVTHELPFYKERPS